jgi:hypothetical protein
MRKWTKQQIFTYVALFVLLAVRFPIGDFASNLTRISNIADLASWVENLKATQDWTQYYLWGRFSFVLVGIVIIVNRGDLKSLNIDKYFIGIFICNGLLYCSYYFLPSGWIAGLISIYMVIMLIRKKFGFEGVKPNLRRIVIFIVIGSFLYLLLMGGSLNTTKIEADIYGFLTHLPFWVMEEVMFRALLWAYLKNLGRSEIKIVIIQALLFWLSHVYHMFTYPIVFWIATPIASILLGIIVWRYKSITPSTIAHAFFNFLWVLS